jgi:tetratricopeptide (TPR) repeat protein
VLHVRLGEPDRAREIARQFEQQVATEHVLFYWLAFIYCELGEFETAIEWLEKAEHAGAGILIIIAVEPAFAPLRPLPRFQALLRKLGLPSDFSEAAAPQPSYFDH